jgi:allantoin racemase
VSKGIRVIEPVTSEEPLSSTERTYVAGARTDVEVSVVRLDKGPASLESDYEDALAVPDLLNKVGAAAWERVNAVVVDCMGNPGLGTAMGLSHSKRSCPTAPQKVAMVNPRE